MPGAGFDRTDENGHWQFPAYGTGTHQASSDSAAFKVLFSYRAEIVSYPDEDVWAPTLQHIGKTVNDWINSDFDDETQALKPNVEDAASHAGDYTLAGHGQPERGHAQGRRPHRADAFGRRKRVLHDLRRLRHLRLPAGRFRGTWSASTWMRTPPRRRPTACATSAACASHREGRERSVHG
ncbi:MAG: hypothetical protein ACLTDR_06040 [Adlercreutzia equolifaciens]